MFWARSSNNHPQQRKALHKQNKLFTCVSISSNFPWSFDKRLKVETRLSIIWCTPPRVSTRSGYCGETNKILLDCNLNTTFVTLDNTDQNKPSVEVTTPNSRFTHKGQLASTAETWFWYFESNSTYTDQIRRVVHQYCFHPFRHGLPTAMKHNWRCISVGPYFKYWNFLGNKSCEHQELCWRYMNWPGCMAV